MRMGQLAKAAGVTVQTIHFYLREGLLPPPVKTAPNMAYYGPEYLEDIRLIKELQNERYLPLGVIHQLLDAKREGHDLGGLREMRATLDWAFGDGERAADGNGAADGRPAANTGPMTLPEYVLNTGLSMDVVKHLEGLGLIGGQPGGRRRGPGGEPPKPYDGLDLRLGRAVKILLEHGLGVDDLELYRRQFDLEREEAALIYDRLLHNRPRSIPRIPTDRLIGTLTELGKTLTLRAVRQVATETHRLRTTRRGEDHSGQGETDGA